MFIFSVTYCAITITRVNALSWSRYLSLMRL